MATIGAVAASPSANLAATGIGLQDFLKILLTQLTYQDPLKPMDNQEFMAQVAQFTTLEQTQQLNSKIDALLSTQASLQSVGLIGRTVDLSTTAGNVSGTVAALSLGGDTPTITVTTTQGATLTGISLPDHRRALSAASVARDDRRVPHRPPSTLHAIHA